MQVRFFGFGCFLLLCSLWLHATPVIRVVTILQLKPDHPTVQLLQQAYQQLGLQMRLDLMPIDRATLELNRGVLVDATLVAAESFAKLNPQLLKVPVPIYQLELRVFSRDPALRVQSWQELRPYQVMFLQGMTSVELRLQQHQVPQQFEVLSIGQALRRLALGRNQLAVLPKAEAEAMLSELKLAQVFMAAEPLEVMPAYHYLHPKHQHLVAPLTQVLSRLTGIAAEAEQHTANEHAILRNLPSQQ